MNFISLFTFRNLRRRYRKFRKMTIKDMIIGLVMFLYTVLFGILHFIYSVCRGFFMLIWTTLFGGGLVEGAKKMTLTEILTNMPDPTQDEVHGDLPPEPGAVQDSGGAGEGEEGTGGGKRKQKKEKMMVEDLVLVLPV